MRIGSETYVAQIFSAKSLPVRADAEPQPDATESSASGGAIQTNDFTNITPKQMRDIAKKLFDEGQIDLDQLGGLTLPNVLGKVGANGEFVPLTAQEREAYDNTPIDYIGMVGRQLASIEHQGRVSDPTSGYGSWKDLLNVLKNLQGGVSGVDVRV